MMVIANIKLDNCMLDTRISNGNCNFDAISSKFLYGTEGCGLADSLSCSMG